MGKRLDWILRRGQKAEPKPSPRTFVFALNRHRFDTWCYYSGTNPRDRDIIVVNTGAYNHALRGFLVTQADTIIVLENVELGHFYKEARRDMLICSGGWVDIEQRQRTQA